MMLDEAQMARVWLEATERHPHSDADIQKIVDELHTLERHAAMWELWKGLEIAVALNADGRVEYRRKT